VIFSVIPGFIVADEGSDRSEVLSKFFIELSSGVPNEKPPKFAHLSRTGFESDFERKNNLREDEIFVMSCRIHYQFSCRKIRWSKTIHLVALGLNYRYLENYIVLLTFQIALLRTNFVSSVDPRSVSHAEARSARCLFTPQK